MRSIFALVLLAAVVLTGGCSQSDTSVSDSTPVNSSCPIMGHEVKAEGGSTNWNGQMIGFCCDGCLPKWNKLSDDDKATKLAEAGNQNHDHNIDEGQDHATHGHEG